jgi:hypothetical protein
MAQLSAKADRLEHFDGKPQTTPTKPHAYSEAVARSKYGDSSSTKKVMDLSAEQKNYTCFLKAGDVN